MSKHVVVGSGLVVTATARELVADGVDEVVPVSRSGAGPTSSASAGSRST